MQEVVRASDTFARLGGDEFVIVVEPISDESNATVVADKLVAALAHPLGDADGLRAHRIGASVGVATYPEDGADGEALIRAADRAMYGAKANGRGCWSRAETALPPRARPFVAN
jgi:diguanylate cyclase (GGDEF)-like protein